MWKVGHVERWRLSGFGPARQLEIDKEECRALLDPVMSRWCYSNEGLVCLLRARESSRCRRGFNGS